MATRQGLFLLALAMTACAAPPEAPPPAATISLRDAMLQTAEALAATRSRAGGVSACGAEAVFHVMALPVTAADGTTMAHLVLAPPEHHEGSQASTVTLMLAADECDAPAAPPARRPTPRRQ